MAQLDEQTQRILTLLKLDAQHLYERIQLRAPEYMLVFSNRRTRDQFKDIFWSRYEQATVSELKLLSPELIIALDEFYTLVDDIKWHLYYTEDMPKTVEDWLYRQLAKLEKKYFNLELYMNAEYGEEELESTDTAEFDLQESTSPETDTVDDREQPSLPESEDDILKLDDL